MKKFLLFLFTILSYGVFAQAPEHNDLIYTFNKDSIKCKITLVNDSWIFYDYKGKRGVKNDYIALNDIKSYIYNGVKIKPFATKENIKTTIILENGDTLHGIVNDGIDKDHKKIITVDGVEKTIQTSTIKSVGNEYNPYSETAGESLLKASKYYFAGVSVVIIGSLVTVIIIALLPEAILAGTVVVIVTTITGVSLNYSAWKRIERAGRILKQKNL